MALDLSTKDKELVAVDAAIWFVNSIKQTGVIPQEADFKKVFPQFSLNNILFILANFAGVRSQKELKEKIAEVLEKLTVFKKTIEAQPEGFEKITLIPPAVEESSYFQNFTPEEVLKELEVERLRLKAAQNSKFTKGFSLPENPPPTPTFYLAPHNPPEPVPVFEKPARVLVQEGICQEDGVVVENYSEKLQDENFKQKLESEIAAAILAEHLENLLSQDLLRLIERQGWAEKLEDSEKRLIVTSFAKDSAKAITSLVSPATPENLPQVQEQVTKSLKDKFTQEKDEVSDFLEAVLATSLNFEEIGLREKTANEVIEAINLALANFSVETVKVSFDTLKPKLTISFYKLLDSKPVLQNLDYYIVPKPLSELEADYYQAKTDLETLVKVTFSQNKIQTATVAGGGESG